MAPVGQLLTVMGGAPSTWWLITARIRRTPGRWFVGYLYIVNSRQEDDEIIKNTYSMSNAHTRNRRAIVPSNRLESSQSARLVSKNTCSLKPTRYCVVRLTSSILTKRKLYIDKMHVRSRRARAYILGNSTPARISGANFRNGEPNLATSKFSTRLTASWSMQTYMELSQCWHMETKTCAYRQKVVCEHVSLLCRGRGVPFCNPSGEDGEWLICLRLDLLFASKWWVQMPRPA